MTYVKTATMTCQKTFFPEIELRWKNGGKNTDQQFRMVLMVTAVRKVNEVLK
jgi:hypothetical protein